MKIYNLLFENLEDDPKYSRLMKQISKLVARLQKYDPEEKYTDWKEIEWFDGSMQKAVDLVASDGALLTKLLSDKPKDKAIGALNQIAMAYEQEFMTLSKAIKKEKSKPQKPGEYKLPDFSAYEINDGGMTFLVLIDPDMIPVGFVGLAEPQKPCNDATQIKYITTNPKYRGKGVGGYLYRAGGLIAQKSLGKSGITSDHTESTTAAAGKVWSRLSKYFDKVSSPDGNTDFDYTGEETPDDPQDDCTIPAEGKPATDSAWQLKGGNASKTQGILSKQLANAKKRPKPEDLGAVIESLWNKTYDAARAEGGLNERLVRWAVGGSSGTDTNGSYRS